MQEISVNVLIHAVHLTHLEILNQTSLSIRLSFPEVLSNTALSTLSCMGKFVISGGIFELIQNTKFLKRLEFQTLYGQELAISSDSLEKLALLSAACAWRVTLAAPRLSHLLINPSTQVTLAQNESSMPELWRVGILPEIQAVGEFTSLAFLKQTKKPLQLDGPVDMLTKVPPLGSLRSFEGCDGHLPPDSLCHFEGLTDLRLARVCGFSSFRELARLLKLQSLMIDHCPDFQAWDGFQAVATRLENLSIWTSDRLMVTTELPMLPKDCTLRYLQVSVENSSMVHAALASIVEASPRLHTLTIDSLLVTEEWPGAAWTVDVLNDNITTLHRA